MKISLIIFIIILFVSCNKEHDKFLDAPPAKIYKLRGDYINHVCIYLSSDNKELLGTPSPKSGGGNPEHTPVSLDSGYYYDFFSYSIGINSAYMTITMEEFQTWYYEVPRDSYMYYILDADPYIEYYIDEEEIMLLDTYKTLSDSFTSDTSFLNYLIRRDELELYFKRLL